MPAYARKNLKLWLTTSEVESGGGDDYINGATSIYHSSKHAHLGQ